MKVHACYECGFSCDCGFEDEEDCRNCSDCEDAELLEDEYDGSSKGMLFM